MIQPPGYARTAERVSGADVFVFEFEFEFEFGFVFNASKPSTCDSVEGFMGRCEETAYSRSLILMLVDF